MATILSRNIQKNCEQWHQYNVPTCLSKIGIYLSALQPFINSIRKPIVCTPEIEAYISHTIHMYFKKDLKLKAATKNICVYSRGCNINPLAVVQYNMQYINDGTR
jgi:hypothetical protein